MSSARRIGSCSGTSSACHARTASNTLIEQYNQAVLDAVRDVAMTGSRLEDLDAERAEAAEAPALVEDVAVAIVPVQVADADAALDPEDAAEEEADRTVEEVR